MILRTDHGFTFSIGLPQGLSFAIEAAISGLRMPTRLTPKPFRGTNWFDSGFSEKTWQGQLKRRLPRTIRATECAPYPMAVI